MEFFEVIGAQRACRRFTSQPVDDDLIEKVLWSATRAPSAENRQPWRFVVVRDRGPKRALFDLARQAWERGGRTYAEQHLTTSVLDDVNHGAMGGFDSAPVAVVVAVETHDVHPGVIGPSVFPAVQNLLLAAGALGLGSVLTTLAVAFGPQIRELLLLPESVEPMAVVPLGWPERNLGPSGRRPLGEVAFREQFGNPW